MGLGVMIAMEVELSEKIDDIKELASRAASVGVPDASVVASEEAFVTPMSIASSMPLSTPTAAVVRLAVPFRKQL